MEASRRRRRSFRLPAHSQWDKQALERPDLALASPLGRLARRGEYVDAGGGADKAGNREQGTGNKRTGRTGGPDVHALFVYNSNPGAVAPNQNAVRRGLTRDDLFTVVHELFFTDTTDYADYILPATTFLEHTDIQGAYGHYFVQLSKQAIEPPGEARSNVWLFGQLAAAHGLHGGLLPRYAGRDDSPGAGDWRRTATRRTPAWSTSRFEDLKSKATFRSAFIAILRASLSCPTRRCRFPRLQGKIEFYSETLAAQGLDALPAFIPPKNRGGVRTRSAFRWSS